jgi:peptide/nickel transport system permease protein
LFSTLVPVMILQEASLSFLGFGLPPPNPSWGSMLNSSARDFMLQDPLLCLWPGLALTIVVYGINMFGDSLRDLLDPRLRGGVGRYGVKVKTRLRQKT